MCEVSKIPVCVVSKITCACGIKDVSDVQVAAGGVALLLVELGHQRVQLMHRQALTRTHARTHTRAHTYIDPR